MAIKLLPNPTSKSHQTRHLPYSLLWMITFFHQNPSRNPFTDKSVLARPKIHQILPEKSPQISLKSRLLSKDFSPKDLRLGKRWSLNWRKGYQTRIQGCDNKEISSPSLTLDRIEQGRFGGPFEGMAWWEVRRISRSQKHAGDKIVEAFFFGASLPSRRRSVVRSSSSLTQNYCFNRFEQLLVCLLYVYKLSTLNCLKTPHYFIIFHHIHLKTHIGKICLLSLKLMKKNTTGSMGIDKNGKKSYKHALFSGLNPSCDQNPLKNNISDQHSPLHPLVEENFSGEIPQNNKGASSSGTKKHKGKQKATIHIKTFLEKLSGVKKSITLLKETRLSDNNSIYYYEMGDVLTAVLIKGDSMSSKLGLDNEYPNTPNCVELFSFYDLRNDDKIMEQNVVS